MLIMFHLHISITGILITVLYY